MGSALRMGASRSVLLLFVCAVAVSALVLACMLAARCPVPLLFCNSAKKLAAACRPLGEGSWVRRFCAAKSAAWGSIFITGWHWLYWNLWLIEYESNLDMVSHKLTRPRLSRHRNLPLIIRSKLSAA